MKNPGKCMLVLAIIFSASQVFASSIQNGGFETGDLTGWGTKPLTGSINVVSSYLGWTANEGTYFALLNSGEIPNAKFTVLKQTFDMCAGQKVCYDYFFFNNFRQSTILGKVSLEFEGEPGRNILSLEGEGDNTPSGTWISACSDPVTRTGEYTIRFKIRNVDSIYNSGVLGIDNVTISGECEEVVPEPMTMIASFMGISALGRYIKKRKN